MMQPSCFLTPATAVFGMKLRISHLNQAQNDLGRHIIWSVYLSSFKSFVAATTSQIIWELCCLTLCILLLNNIRKRNKLLLSSNLVGNDYHVMLSLICKYSFALFPTLCIFARMYYCSSVALQDWWVKSWYITRIICIVEIYSFYFV